MRLVPPETLERARRVHPTIGPTDPGDMFGYFEISTGAGPLRIISSGSFEESFGWEHVSVSLAHRCPTWGEMARVKELFWEDEECVVQFHVPKSEHVNLHPHCLHLWKPRNGDIPRPPRKLV